MPYRVQGKVVGDDGLSIYQAAEIAEYNTQGVKVANMLTNEDTGAFSFMASSENATIKVLAIGYKEQMYLAKNIPTEIRLQQVDDLILNGAPKKNKSLWWVLGGLAAIAVTAVALSQKDKNKAAATAKTVKAAPKVKPKSVTV